MSFQSAPLRIEPAPDQPNTSPARRNQRKQCPWMSKAEWEASISVERWLQRSNWPYSKHRHTALKWIEAWHGDEGRYQARLFLSREEKWCDG